MTNSRQRGSPVRRRAMEAVSAATPPDAATLTNWTGSPKASIGGNRTR